jgi:cardiolipin synthase (CMP-forming)
VVRQFDWGSRGTQRVHDRVLTVPNLITAVRLAGLPVFVWLVVGADAPAAAFGLLVAVAATDWVDGYVARRFDQVSRIGALLDPLVDRLLIAVVVVTLLVAGIVPGWVVVAVLLRDVLLLGGAFVVFHGIPPIPVTRTGKTATALLMIGLPAFLLAEVAGGDPLRLVAFSFTIVGVSAYYGAGVQYARAALDLRRGSGA